MKKRGISPLIATVLLIGFTITIAAAIMMWAGDYIKERAEKEGIRGEAQSECITSVDVKLKDLKCEQDKITAIIENKGSVKIGYFRARITGDGTQTITLNKAIDKLSQEELVGTHTVSNPKSVQFLPVIIKQKEGKTLPYTCSEKMIEANC